SHPCPASLSTNIHSLRMSLCRASLHPTLCHVDRSLPSFQLNKLETRFQHVLFAICIQEDIGTAIGLWVLLGIEWQELLLHGLLWV
ncbi:hypothetical protein GALMADRAFT_245838, partial [Galerina marginata CBS 339.88]